MKRLRYFYRTAIVAFVAIVFLILGIILIFAETTEGFDLLLFIVVKLLAVIFIGAAILLIKIILNYYEVFNE